MATNKTKQAREQIQKLLKNGKLWSLQVLAESCGCGIESLAGALASLVEKEEICIFRSKKKTNWLIGRTGLAAPTGEISYADRDQMRNVLPEILEELKKCKFPTTKEPGSEATQNQFKILFELLSDGQPRSKIEIIAETGIEDLTPALLRKFPQLPDGRYTLPDSKGAWSFLLKYLGEKPRRLSDLLRLFRDHRELSARLAAGNDQEPFIKLSRSLITTRDSREGKEELARRRQVKAWQDTLDSYPRPFFIPEKLGPDPAYFQEVADRYTVSVQFAGKNYRCLRREFPGEIFVEQIGLLSGRYFAPPHLVSPPSFLKENSTGEKEAANVLGLSRENLTALIESGDLDYFILDERPRLWRSDIKELKKDSARLRELTARHDKFKVVEAEALLGIPAGYMKQLIEDGTLNSLSSEINLNTNSLISRSEFDILRKNLAAIKSRWNLASGAGKRSESPGREGLTKKKPPKKIGTLTAEQEEIRLDKFQVDAFEALRKGNSVLVSAPTGNGKTLVAEMLAKDLMAAGRGMVYTSPLKALSNQKYRDFKDLFGKETVGLVTGDISINPGAPMLIMTTEIFRNWCLSDPGQLENISYVVFDEIHYLDDAERGTTWEESILFAPSHIKILGLSATVPNIEEMADWIYSVRGEKVVVIRENERNVPLEIRWILPSGRIVSEKEARVEIEDLAEYVKTLRSKKHWIEE